MDEPHPYRVDVPEPVLVDLRERLARTNWFDDLGDDDWSMGVSAAYLRELCEYWRTEFDWRAQEALLNSFDQFVVTSDGQPIHFVHAPSPEPEAMPLLVCHGWPGSIFEYLPDLDRLRDPASHGGDPADAFHVVCMSIPGYGFSGPTLQPGWGPTRISAAFAEIMAGLGYDRYAAGGGDWGGIIITALARADQGEHLIALHLTSPAGEQPPADAEVAPLSDADRAGLADWTRHQAEGTVVHVPINTTRPHTLAFALNDSPAGLAAWLIDKFRSYSDNDGDIEASFTKDELLAHVTTYWVTGTIASASRLYYERVQEGIGAAAPPFITVPTTVAIFPRDVKRAPRPWAERHYNVVRWAVMPAGGHFGAEEEPDVYVADVREALRPFRDSGTAGPGRAP